MSSDDDDSHGGSVLPSLAEGPETAPGDVCELLDAARGNSRPVARSDP
ncbi:hypothetical protein BQ8420_27010 [Nocardiopsis sp. JB363]|nr:hypothetical protein BQ8420_27010 [Nocardiopsis sp. JB363]